MNYWLLLADPKSYGFDDLEKEKKAVWDGISGARAQRHLREIKKGDRALVYHTAPDKAVIGIANVVSDPYPDPADKSGRRVVIDVQPRSRLSRPVSLASMRENKKLEGMTFLKIQRIAVLPVTREQFDEIAGS